MKKPSSPNARSAGKSAPPKAHAEAAPQPLLIDHDLEKSIPYLLARAGTRMGNAFSQELKRFDLTLTEWRVCVALRHKSKQRLSELAGHTSADLSTLSRIVDSLIARKLVWREQSAEDARALALSLTGAGAELAERIIPLAQLYERVAMGGINPANADLLREMLERLYDNIGILEKPH